MSGLRYTSIATAHDAGLKVLLRPGGGLSVEVHFPAPKPAANGGRGTITQADDTERTQREARSPIKVPHRRPG